MVTKISKSTDTTESRLSRKYDVVLYGASGFVGQQTVAYFAKLGKLSGPHGKPLRWALAGRSAQKLEAVRAACGIGAKRAGIVVADAQDAKALDALASATAVVLSTAGPFALYGSELVAACAANGTHYVDITGETPWVFDMICQHESAAVQSGARIIPFCGFDSIPSDLGAWLVATTMQDTYGEPCQSVKASFSVRGGVNGGTLASMFNFLGTDQAKKLAEPFLLNPPNSKARSVVGQQDPVTPIHDADFKAWLGPFFMGPINTRVVRRSAALSSMESHTGRGKAKANSGPYSSDFTYQEYMRFGAGPLAGAAAAVFCAGMFSSQQAMRFKPLRQLAGRLAPGPGTGPSEASMDGGSFRCELVGRSASGHVVRGRVADQGDPGNRATTKMVCEAALCLALQLDELPGSLAKGGFLTPATGLGAVLLKRLRDAGMTLECA